MVYVSNVNIRVMHFSYNISKTWCDENIYFDSLYKSNMLAIKEFIKTIPNHIRKYIDCDFSITYISQNINRIGYDSLVNYLSKNINKRKLFDEYINFVAYYKEYYDINGKIIYAEAYDYETAGPINISKDQFKKKMHNKFKINDIVFYEGKRYKVIVVPLTIKEYVERHNNLYGCSMIYVLEDLENEHYTEEVTENEISLIG